MKKQTQTILVGTLVLTSILTTTPSFAAEPDKDLTTYAKVVAYEDSISVETAISNIRGTLSLLQQNIMNGALADGYLEQLAIQLNQLERAVKSNGATAEVVSLLDEVEDTIGDIRSGNANKARVALSAVKDSLGTIKTEDNIQVQAPLANISFGDIETHWAKDNIIAMCQGSNPLFKGTGDINGVPQFSPDRKMSGYEFITVICRAMWPNEIPAQEGGNWFRPYLNLAIAKGILNEGRVDYSKPITRQDMASMMVKVMELNGETPTKLVPTGNIADYNQIGDAYQRDVRIVFSMGIINGTDSNGTFSPTVTVDRGQGATILYRLLNPTQRIKIDFTDRNPSANDPYASSVGQIAITPADTLQTFKEGEPHTAPQVGDTVIRASDGKAIVIENGIGGVLGAGQGVDIWTGLKWGNGTLEEGEGILEYSGTPFKKDKITSEMHTREEWQIIQSVTYPGREYNGDYEGEVFNTWWEWCNILGGTWCWIGPSC